ncbi:hypothetical protein NDU88_007468 [Pleurodeles waltl]|uniref:Uncharacterized protein n=1 Tax=Pleurodeles waltl TaxID=8319 RepID=A0AAV7RRW3_PLEWA|nr:hypothetical protein NDU88_007468 [Pleurodeles waltl]
MPTHPLVRANIRSLKVSYSEAGFELKQFTLIITTMPPTLTPHQQKKDEDQRAKVYPERCARLARADARGDRVPRLAPSKVTGGARFFRLACPSVLGGTRREAPGFSVRPRHSTSQSTGGTGGQAPGSRPEAVPGGPARLRSLWVWDRPPTALAPPLP